MAIDTADVTPSYNRGMSREPLTAPKAALPRQHPESAAPAVARKPQAWEWGVLLVILLCGASVRLTMLSRTTVEHFDEGVYSSNLWFGQEDGYHYPQRHLYAPPLVPWLIEWTMIFAGRVDGSLAVIPAVLAGVATVPLVWWLAWRTFGTTAALASGALCSVSSVHVLLSRSALTDALLLFWFLLALLLWERAWRLGRWSSFILAGVVTGLAWWTKYNGWLPQLISAGAIVAATLAGGWGIAGSRRRIAGWFIAGATAAFLWLPYLLSLQSQGGYTAVAANHRQYVVGLKGWGASLVRQIENLHYLSSAWNTDGMSLIVAAIMAVWLLRRLWSRRREVQPVAATWLVLAGFVLLTLMTPLYTPYPRLVLPWLSMGWLLAGMAAEECQRWLARRAGLRAEPESKSGEHAGPGPQKQTALLACGTAALVVLIGQIGLFRGPVWEDRRDLQRAAVDIREASRTAASTGQPPVLDVYGEPALFFQLRAVGAEFVSAVQDVHLTPVTQAGSPLPTFLVFGPHARRDPRFLAGWKDGILHYRFVGVFSYRPSPLVLLDNYSPRELADTREETVELWQLRGG